MIGVGVDITERHKVEAALRQARDAAEQANQMKSTFLASMSHELRTPLNAILNFSEFLADGVLGEVNAKQEETLRKVIGSGEHLLALINDILDISKIEVGMMELFVEEFNLVAELYSVAATGKGLVKNKPVEMKYSIPDDLPHLTGDRRRIHQVLLNLVSNAVKFTKQGEVTMQAVREGDSVLITVQDTGAGIAPEDHALIFQSFKQTRQGMREHQGTGLGLPISKAFVEAHGGRIWLEAAPGSGTTFYVRLPLVAQLKAPQGAQAAAQAASEGQG
ncbi:MAG: hypothetical protein HC915_21540 [Anaerolineae bacterium]|nr:hypothetical protein [Anaerolineae bacterium]